MCHRLLFRSKLRLETFDEIMKPCDRPKKDIMDLKHKKKQKKNDKEK